MEREGEKGCMAVTKALLKCQLMVPRHPADEQGKKGRKKEQKYICRLSPGAEELKPIFIQ